jgi:hypothetical protein
MPLQNSINFQWFVRGRHTDCQPAVPVSHNPSIGSSLDDISQRGRYCSPSRRPGRRGTVLNRVRAFKYRFDSPLLRVRRYSKRRMSKSVSASSDHDTAMRSELGALVTCPLCTRQRLDICGETGDCSTWAPNYLRHSTPDVMKCWFALFPWFANNVVSTHREFRCLHF